MKVWIRKKDEKKLLRVLACVRSDSKVTLTRQRGAASELYE